MNRGQMQYKMRGRLMREMKRHARHQAGVSRNKRPSALHLPQRPIGRDEAYARGAGSVLVWTCALWIICIIAGLFAVAVFGLILIAIEFIVWAIYHRQFCAAGPAASMPPPPVAELPQVTFREAYEKRRGKDRQRAHEAFAGFQRSGLIPLALRLPSLPQAPCYYHVPAQCLRHDSQPIKETHPCRVSLTLPCVVIQAQYWTLIAPLTSMAEIDALDDGGILLLWRLDGQVTGAVVYLDYPLEFLVLLLCTCKVAQVKPPLSPEFARQIMNEAG